MNPSAHLEPIDFHLARADAVLSHARAHRGISQIDAHFFLAQVNQAVRLISGMPLDAAPGGVALFTEHYPALAQKIDGAVQLTLVQLLGRGAQAHPGRVAALAAQWQAVPHIWSEAQNEATALLARIGLARGETLRTDPPAQAWHAARAA